MGNTAKDDVIVLGEREFKRVKNGLDEAQVASFIDELIKERDKLAKSQEHIASLNRLAEMSIVEADKLAAQIKTEAAEQAKAESAAIIDRAKEQARQISEKKIAEAVRTANEQADAIKAKAEEEAVLLLENQKNKIRGELRNLVNQQFGYMLEEMESLKQQAAAVQADFGNKLSEPREENSTITEEIAEKTDAAAAEIAKESDTIVEEIAKESDTIVEEIAKESDTIVAEIAEKIDAAAAEIARENDTVVAEASKKTLGEHLEPSRATDHTEKSSELSKLLQIEEQPELDKPQWEVEILPPFDISKIMEVVSFLDQLPEVANTEMIVPQIDMPSILVFLRKPMNVVDVLQKIPAVAYVEEVTPKTAAANGRPRKVRINLSGNKKS
jgi:cell division septum initiation protein DivIVA